tara:strand:- start:22 stop:243 length:222 start_codon:yes stop_codon:yes gene_type:complete
MAKRREPDFRIRYKKTLPEPNRLVVWDVNQGTEYECSSFELKNCDIKMIYGNSKAQEIQCGAKAILEVYKNDK